MKYADLYSVLIGHMPSPYYLRTHALFHEEEFAYFKPAPDRRASACLVARRDPAFQPPPPVTRRSTVRWSVNSPLVWRSDRPLGSRYLAGQWAALALRTMTGCAVLIVNDGCLPDAIAGCGARLRHTRYFIGFDLPWRKQMAAIKTRRVFFSEWFTHFGWEVNPALEKPYTVVSQLGRALRKPAVNLSAGFLHAGTRAETLNLGDLLWSYKTLLFMLQHEKETYSKMIQTVVD